MNKELEQIRIYISKDNIKYIKEKNESLSKFIDELITKERKNETL